MAADGGGPREEDILRVLISTDNHLGFLERDAIRGADSFAAFEEVLQLAVAREVDTVLLAGDIFHENRPSRYTLWRTMEILRTYVMGPAQIRVQCVSDYDAARVLAPSAAKPVLVVAGAGVGAGAGARAGAGAGGAGVDGGAGGVGAGAPTGRRSRAQIAADDKAAAAVAARASRAAAAAALAPPPATSAESRARVFGMFSRVNWEDPNFNIALPIFSIHGNHDDPSREGPGEGSILAPLDILAAASLVNYFGKAESTDSVSLVPVLLAKGATRLALYGVGNVREDRMQRMFQADKVRFRRPAALSEDWFNLLLIHQNRDQRTLRTKSQSLGIDACLPSFLDVVVWGHEHECILATEHCSRRPDADADDVDGGIARSTRIIQPGSTVATSLCEGEARRKHAVVLEICGPLYRRINVPLRCVRPFKMAEISLASEGLDADAADVGERIVALLTKKVEELIVDAARGWPEDADGGGDAGQETEDMRPPRAMRLPLVRLKVEHTGFQMVAAARFGAAFIGRVANPGEMLHLFRRPKRIRATGGASSSAAIPAVLPSQLGTAGLEELVKEALATSKAAGRGLVTVSQDSLVTAVHRYTHNEDAKAIKEAIETAVETRRHKTNAHAAVKEANLLEVSTAKLRSIVKEANAEMTALEEEEFAQMSPEEREREAEARRMQAAINHEAGEAASVSDDASAASDAPKGAKGKGAKARAPAKPRAKAAAKKAPTKRGRRGSDEEEEEEEEDDDDYESAPAPKRAAAARKPKAASPRRRPSEDDVVEIGDDEEEVRPPPPSRGASKAKAAPKAPVIPAALAPPARGAAAPIWPGAVTGRRPTPAPAADAGGDPSRVSAFFD